MTLWKPASDVLPLAPGSIHIWLANLDLSLEQISDLQSLLSAEESQRALRFKFSHHRQRFIAAKGILRTLLGQYLNVPPKAITFIYGSHGKPELEAQQFQATPLYFNQSDSHSFALYAFSQIKPIGVDIEHIRPDIEALSLTERFFSPNEALALKKQPKEQQIPAFFRIWTRKEAFIKAVGEGLSFPLHAFEVNLDEDSATLMSIYKDTTAARPWSLLSLKPTAGYVGAVAIEAHIKDMQLFNYLHRP